MLLQLALLIGSLLVLAKASDFTVKNAVKLSKFSGISQVVIGFILIAVATSLPELTIGVISSISGDGALSLGNIIGANIVNVALIFGLLSFIGFKMTKKDVEKTTFSVMLISIVGIFVIITGATDIVMGIFLLIIFYIFSKTMLKDGIKIKKMKDGRSTGRYALLTVLGIILIMLSAKAVTDSAIEIALSMSLSETLIGAAILSIGTTLPELSVGLAAVRRRNPELAVGDGIGSIVTNITLVLGVASIINPIAIDAVARISMLSMILISAAFVLIARRLNFDKRAGILLLLMYAAYLAIILGF